MRFKSGHETCIGIISYKYNIVDDRDNIDCNHEHGKGSIEVIVEQADGDVDSKHSNQCLCYIYC